MANPLEQRGVSIVEMVRHMLDGVPDAPRLQPWQEKLMLVLANPVPGPIIWAQQHQRAIREHLHVPVFMGMDFAREDDRTTFQMLRLESMYGAKVLAEPPRIVVFDEYERPPRRPSRGWRRHTRLLKARTRRHG